MEYAYANIRWDGTVGITPGHYVAVIHDTATLFFIAPEQVEKLEENGELDRGGMFVRMIKFHPADQFANIVLPGEVAKLAESANVLVETINEAGGIYLNHKGLDLPVEYPKFSQLADAYVKSCAALGINPLRDEDREESEAQAKAEYESLDHHEQRVHDEYEDMEQHEKEKNRGRPGV